MPATPSYDPTHGSERPCGPMPSCPLLRPGAERPRVLVGGAPRDAAQAGISCGAAVRDHNLCAPMLPDELEQRLCVLGTETDTAMTGWTAELPNGGRGMDRKSALEEQSVRHGRVVVLARVPHALHPLNGVAPRWRLVTPARRRHRPGVDRSAIHHHGHALGGGIDMSDDAR